MIEIRVHGEPGPQGSKKFVRTSATGRGIMVESSAKVKPWRQAVVDAGVEARRGPGGMECAHGAVVVEMIFTVKKPSSAPKRKITYPDKKPDLSKLARSTEDALTVAGIWEDDARVIEYVRLAKVFPNEDRDALDSPGVLIRLHGRTTQ